MPPACGYREALSYLLRRRRRFRVAGDSMYPTLSSGQEVLVDHRAYRRRAPQPGELVVASHPHTPSLKIVKRVARVDSNGVYLSGDNPDPTATTDSRSWGALPLSALIGKVRCVCPS